MTELKSIPHLRYYEVSDDGRIRSLPRWVCTGTCLRFVHGCERKFSTASNGYSSFRAADRTWFVHIIVANVFVPNPDNLPWVNHKDGVKTNCHKDNLEWTTPRGNVAHAISMNLRNTKSKLTESDVIAIRADDRPCRVIAIDYGVSKSTIEAVRSRRNWKHL